MTRGQADTTDAPQNGVDLPGQNARILPGRARPGNGHGARPDAMRLAAGTTGGSPDASAWAPGWRQPRDRLEAAGLARGRALIGLDYTIPSEQAPGILPSIY